MSGLVARIARDLRTARHIPPAQLAHRMRFLALRRLYAVVPTAPIQSARRRARGARPRARLPRVPHIALDPSRGPRARARAADAAAGRFTHLGVVRDYGSAIDWRDPTVSPLWAYQMHYLGAVVDCALARRAGDAASILQSWNTAFGDRWDAVAWHPYPVSLRLVNVCHAASVLGSFAALGDDAVSFVATHARYLEEHLERDVRGNHLLENAVALVTAAHFIDGAADGRAALRLLRDVVAEQILPDGMHFELSPMYHAIVLTRLVLVGSVIDDALTSQVLLAAVETMTSRLAWLRCPDGGLPLLGDSVREFALPAGLLVDLGDMQSPGRSELAPSVRASAPEGLSAAPDAGLHILRDGPLWCILDAGAICPTYLPAHGQADTLSVEVWIDDACLVTDPGLHEYTGDERAWGRSSRAHSTITVDDRDASEVYGSFRVGGRETLESVDAGDDAVTATLRPWGIAARLTRRVSLPGDGVLRVEDQAAMPARSAARSRLHLHPDVEVVGGEGSRALDVRVRGREVTIRGEHPLTLEAGRCSRRFGEIQATQIVVMELARDATSLARGWMAVVPGKRITRGSPR